MKIVAYQIFGLGIVAILALACLKPPPPPDQTPPPKKVSCELPDAQDQEITTTDLGEIQGICEENVFAFRGIPYAAPPIGENRWKAPKPALPLEETFEAIDFGAICPQVDNQGNVIGNEDCLFLNIWTPTTSPESKLPVMVFLHGGFNIRGASSDEVGGVRVYDGADLATAGGVVVVTLNYRLGVLGFLAHSALADETGSVGNYALRDQVAALEWIQRNISSFGGDTSRVTLFGQSAGSVDTCALLTSPQAAGLFSRAMMLSGSCSAQSSVIAQEIAQELIENLVCDKAENISACLRALSVEQLIASTLVTELSNHLPHPTIDGSFLPLHPIETMNAGKQNQVSVIVSTTTEEVKILEPGLLQNPLQSEAGYEFAVRSFFTPPSENVTLLQHLGMLGEGLFANTILDTYPSKTYPSFNDAFLAILGDVLFICPARRALRALENSQSDPVRQAVFGHTFENGALKDFGAAHGFDLFFGFAKLTPFGASPSKEEVWLSNDMIEYWSRFAYTGDPNGDNDLFWPLSQKQNSFFLWETPLSTDNNFRAAECDMWDQLQ